MDLSEIFKLSLRSITRNKTRSALTMLGIVIGVSSVILLVSLGQGLQDFVTGQFEKLGSNIIYVIPGKIGTGGFGGGPPSFTGSKLTLKQVSGIAKLGGAVADAGGGTQSVSPVKYKGKSMYGTVVGGTGNYMKLHTITVSMGRTITETDVKLGRKVVVIGKDVVTKLFGQLNPIGKEIIVGNQTLTVIGVFSDLGSVGSLGGGNDHSFVPITVATKIFGSENLQTISVKAVSKEDIPAAIKQTKKYLLRELTDDDFSVMDSSSLLSTINQILSVLTAALGGIAAISLVVGGVGIMNIMLVTVTERTKEIGLRKAVGAKPKDILIQFVIEAVVLSVLGGVIGILVGAGGALLMNSIFPTSVSLWSVSLAFGVSAIVGVIFGVAPALKASRLNPIDALRYE